VTTLSLARNIKAVRFTSDGRKVSLATYDNSQRKQLAFGRAGFPVK